MFGLNDEKFKEWINLYTNLSYSSYSSDDEKDTKNMIEVKLSNVHHKGVFALRDIKAGEFITIYPAHFIYKLNGMDKILLYPLNTLEKSNPDYDAFFDFNILISGNPNLTNNLQVVGHMINDGGDISDIKLEDKYHNVLYDTTVEKNINCTYEIGKYKNIMVLWVVATKLILKGEELFTSYGIDYWKNKIK